MKKVIGFFIFVFGFNLFIIRFCLAAPVGNPAGPAILEGRYPTKFSLQTEVVFKRELKNGPTTAKFNGLFYTGKASFYVNKKLDIYGIAGTYNGKVKNFFDGHYIIESKMAGVFGLGASYVLYEWALPDGILRLGADAKYRHFKPDVDNITWWRQEISAGDAALTFSEWQTSLGLAYQYKKFVPYCGLKYSDMDARIKFTQGPNAQFNTSIKSKTKIGLFYGTDVLVADNISFNIEGRSFDENAVNIELNARF